MLFLSDQPDKPGIWLYKCPNTGKIEAFEFVLLDNGTLFGAEITNHLIEPGGTWCRVVCAGEFEEALAKLQERIQWLI